MATNLRHLVAVRDSKDERGAVLTFAPAAWARFVTVTRIGFDKEQRD
ncbi:DUF397 domain-containing protein [Micromonospora sp. NPDC007220]